MNIQNNPALRDQLAAEYVLGTLRGGARRRFEGWLRDDLGLRDVVGEWQGRLMPLAEFAPSAAPPARLWSRIEQRLRIGRSTAPTSWLPGSLSFWRGLGLASTALATVLVAVLVTREPVIVTEVVKVDVPVPASASISHIATLTDDKAQNAVLVTADAKNGSMVIRVVGGAAVPDAKTLQLWAVPKKGTPRSLGLIAREGETRVALPSGALAPEVLVLAVSLEPQGGSPDPNGPTGPVLYKGPWIRI